MCFILLFSFVNIIFFENVSADDGEYNGDYPAPTIITPIRYLLYKAGRLTTLVVPIFQMFAAAVVAEPNVIEIGYNETVPIEIGMMDFDTGTFMEAPNQAILKARFLNFDVLEYPSGNNEYSWNVEFDPFTVDMKSAGLAKTNVSISLRAPPINENAIQSGVLKIVIIDTWAYGNLYWPKNVPGFESLWRKFNWFITATIINKFGKYSGTVSPEYHEIEVLIKVKPYHAVELDTIPLVEFAPDDIASIPIGVTNIGNYNDTINFRVVSKYNDIKLTDPPSIALAPGEKKNTYLGVAVPPRIFDTGTFYQIKIEAYSIDDPNLKIAERIVFLETKGVHVNEASGSGFVSLSVLLILCVAFIYYRRKKRYNQICVKPNKPWKIPEEEIYLEELKSKDKQKYNETLKIMHDEYESSLLWYRNYCDSVLNQKYKKKTPIKKEVKKKEKIKPLEKPMKKKEELTKPEEIKPEKPILKEKKPAIKKAALVEDTEKKRAIKRIQRQQEKQKRKFKNLVGKREK